MLKQVPLTIGSETQSIVVSVAQSMDTLLQPPPVTLPEGAVSCQGYPVASRPMTLAVTADDVDSHGR